tara:strand:+ start:2945 stop:4660 length:1716 start_codon:yes stop_codon:yes gene_type:complete
LIIFDLESNGLLDDMTKIHCLAMFNTTTEEFRTFEPDQIDEAVEILSKADAICGHNVIGFDVPAIRLIYPDFETNNVVDTLVLSRLLFPNIKDKDFVSRPEGMDVKLFGKHSLKAWGHRLGTYKDEYDAGFEEYSQEMMDYMVQDVRVTVKLYEHCLAQEPSDEAFTLEHQVASVCHDMERTGFVFDTNAAAQLYAELSEKRNSIKTQMEEEFAPTVIQLKTKTKYVPFNPGSRQQIADRLQGKYKWRPTQFTPAGQAKIDETILEKLPYPEAKLLADYFMLEKRIAMIAEGNQGYLKLVNDNNLLRGRYIPNGAVSGRATHFAPNIAQVPSMRLPYGREIRSLFTVPSDWALVGCDLSGLELRCLAHFMHTWDSGEYAAEVLNGDIHTKNQEAAGLPDRDAAKRFIYSLIYGAGDQKLGEVIGKGRNEGRQIREKFFAAIPAIKSLRSAIEQTVETRKYLYGLDRRKLYARSSHSAVNLLLQSAGALIAKRWLIIARDNLKKHRYEHGWDKDYVFCAWVHDEVQVACRKEIAEDVGNIIRGSATEAGESFDFRCRIDAEYSVGTSWATTH